jgi:serine/threonine-protein kinase CHEK1
MKPNKQCLQLSKRRDISLENFVIDENGNLVLIDFGMCLKIPTEDVIDNSGRLIRQSFPFTPQGQCGKPNYMSPEIYRNNSFYGEAVDVWSLGVILFMLVSGERPYNISHRSDTGFVSTTNDLVEYLRSFGVRMSNEGIGLLQGMLQENPTERLSLGSILSHPCLTDQAPFFEINETI